MLNALTVNRYDRHEVKDASGYTSEIRVYTTYNDGSAHEVTYTGSALTDSHSATVAYLAKSPYKPILDRRRVYQP